VGWTFRSDEEEVNACKILVWKPSEKSRRGGRVIFKRILDNYVVMKVLGWNCSGLFNGGSLCNWYKPWGCITRELFVSLIILLCILHALLYIDYLTLFVFVFLAKYNQDDNVTKEEMDGAC
jgi:hypothetical protein